MTVDRLLGDLKASGTGESKLEAGRAELIIQCDAGECKRDQIDLERFLDRVELKKVWPEGTLAKAKEFVNQYLAE